MKIDVKKITFLILILTVINIDNLCCQNFSKIIGDNKNNSFNKAIYVDGNYFLTGQNDGRATLTKLSNSGDIIWVNEINKFSFWRDLIADKGKIILVGNTGNVTENLASLIGIYDINKSQPISIKEYDFGINFRDLIVNVIKNPNNNDVLAKYIATGIEVYQGTLTDKLFLLHLNANGGVTKRLIYGQDGRDHEYYGITVDNKNGDLLLYGNQFNGDNHGVNLKIKNNGDVVGGKEFQSNHFYTSHYTYTDSKNKIVQFFGGTNRNEINKAMISKYIDGNIDYTFEFNNVDRIQKILKLAENEFRVLGFANINSILKPVIFDFIDNKLDFKIKNVFIINNDAFESNFWFIDKFENNKFIYIDGSWNAHDGFGMNDGLVILSDGNMVNCIKGSYNINVNPINLISQNFTVNKINGSNISGINISTNNLTFDIIDYCKCTEIFKNTLYEAICDGESVLIGNELYYESGQYVQTLKNSNGCDSIITLELKVGRVDEYYSNVKLCKGDSILFFDNWYKEAGEYIQAYKNIEGCDSTFMLQLEVKESINTKLKYSICEGESVIINNKSYKEQGLFEEILTGRDGCDSILTFEIIYKNVNADFQYSYDHCSKTLSLLSEHIDDDRYIIKKEDSIYSETTDNQIMLNAGLYEVTHIVNDSTICSAERTDIVTVESPATIEDISLPNIIAPDRPGNDEFCISNSLGNQFIFNGLKIYDRFGNLVFYTSSSDICWDGRFNGRNCETGVYTFILEIKEQNCFNQNTMIKGDITVLR